MSALCGTGMGIGVPAAGGFTCSVCKIKVKPNGKGVWCTKRRVSLSIRAASSNRTVVEYETGKDERARFAGDDTLSKLVNLIISVKPIYSLLKLGAKNVMVRTAEQNGIAWKEMVEEMKASDVFAEKENLENAAVVYPDYYTKPFHAYENGNLSWEAAFDVEPATRALWKRTLPSAKSWQEAGDMVRGKWVEAIQAHHCKFSSGLLVSDILELGCSTANSTRFLANYYNNAQVTGLDLSPYFLSVAQYLEKRDPACTESRRKSIRFVHGNAESTNLPSKSFDIVTVAFLLHECPRDASRNILKEAYRLLRPGGTIAITDQSPKSKVIQELPPALFTLMKTTEPWLDEYYLLDLESELVNCGFTHIRSILTSPRHFTCTATAAM
ncbi:hypothetical protein R1flu_020035 [Riccia fluitans]|uniref:Methyltransferase type 11 domain-containing protein n=1 Tax=Riccia fluitans TaxID=41844 RepID=A0ABD1ZLG6_9MARC